MQPTSTAQRSQALRLADRVKLGGSGLPSRHFLLAGEDVLKTSAGAAAPSPVFLMSRGETGLLSLIDFGRVVRYHRDVLHRWLATGSCPGRTAIADCGGGLCS
jgi:hypothetical protein